jgi:hypothetical protein
MGGCLPKTMKEQNAYWSASAGDGNYCEFTASSGRGKSLSEGCNVSCHARTIGHQAFAK